MWTTEYPYFNPPFFEYNVAQSAAVPFLDKDVNLVISFHTAVGKSILACGAFGFHLTTEVLSKCIYVAPFRSLAEEKYDDWKNEPQFSQAKTVLNTSDSAVTPEEFAESRLVVMTLESFDAKIRNERHKQWIKQASVVVFDEAHLLSTPGRGAAMESAMMQMTLLNPNARLMLLSGTMGNAMEIAKWVKSLNGKQTKCIVSNWRPVKLDINWHTVDDGKEEKIKKAIELAKENKGKTIVFVHSKHTGAEIVKRLRTIGVRAAFHNASVAQSQRRKIEELFSQMGSGMNVIVATSTLGTGVNL